MSQTFWTKPFLDLAQTVWSTPEERWIDDSPRQADIAMLEKEAADSKFDTAGYEIEDPLDLRFCTRGSTVNVRGGNPNTSVGGVLTSVLDGTRVENLRSEMLALWRSGSADLKVRELPGRTRLVFLGTDEQWSQIPWRLWSRILQAIGHPIGYLLFYAHPKKREYPDRVGKVGNTIEAEHINAGYSFICQQHTVVIYRFEEATRVLVHELLHTACFDSELPVEHLEASTEAWAEVFLCALLSKGKAPTFMKLWRKQCAWITAQTTHLKTEWSIQGPADYCWRYLIGRHEVLKAKGYMLEGPAFPAVPGLRFTTPEWDLYCN